MMSHWQGYGRAPGYSREVESANHAVREAEDHLRHVLQQEYPENCPVRVVHSRGQFRGKVIGWDVYGVRVIVRNDRTGKVNKWWAAHVERLPVNDAQEAT